MKNLKFLIIGLIYSSVLLVQGQTLFKDNCNDALIVTIQELNGFKSTNPDYSNPTGCSPLCPTGGGAHNTGWAAFSTPGGRHNFTIVFDNCTVNGTGVQFGIWGDCNCSESIFCDPSCTGPGTKSFDAVLEPFKVYYLFLDGCTGDVCDYTLFIGPPVAQVNPRIFLDNNNNCTFENSDVEIQNLTLVDSFNGVKKYRDINDLTFDIYSYEVGKHFFWINDDLFGSANCSPMVELDIQASNTPLALDMGIKPLAQCPVMAVELTSTRYRVCSTSVLKVNYINLGTEDAQNSIVDVTLPTTLTYLSSSIPVLSSSGNKYTFDLGTVEPFVKKDFTISVEVTCNPSMLGMTACTEAHIYPDTICTDSLISPKGSISLSVKCDPTKSKVIFSVDNKGDQNMDSPVPYYIVEDEIMPTSAKGLIQLNKEESKLIELAANGNTYRLFVEQVKNHPGKSKPTIAIEGCGFNQQGTFSTGFIMNFPEDEEDLFIAEYCGEILGSYDPNEKVVVPNGNTNKNLVKKTDLLEYTIHYQNLGNDYAERVRITDKIDPNLDLSTFQIIGSSHPYTYLMVDNHIQFLMDNIRLEAKSVNELKSQGYISYHIKPKQDLIEGSKIDNIASIFFDYNPAILTNEVHLEIYEPVITSTSEKSSIESIKIYPNPAKEQFAVELKETTFPAQLRITNAEGKIVLKHNINQEKTTIELENSHLNKGIYLIEIINDKGFKATSKLVISEKQ